MEKIYKTLARIEQLLLSNKSVFTLKEFCQFAGISLSFGYKLTHHRKIKFSRPNGKLIFVSREAAESYLLSNPVSLTEEIEKEAVDHINQEGRKFRWDN